VFVPEQVPQAKRPPQPSATVPQLAPAAAQVVGLQPQTFVVPPPPQVWPVPEHVPHESVPPHPSATEPQFLPRVAHVPEHTQRFEPLQVYPLLHAWPLLQSQPAVPQ
jgi:hypothetical protein